MQILSIISLVVIVFRSRHIQGTKGITLVAKIRNNKERLNLNDALIAFYGSKDVLYTTRRAILAYLRKPKL